jgi:DNA helicase-2/ATP-dependent DNA helicase PcrA
MPDTFQLEYQKLNAEQRLAVDTIEGPVMVIAGAGTGKTQTIALRVGQILNQTQVNPSNILCLTFTDSAAINMRQRLLSLIGPSSYGVRICTFHAFCNSVIKDHPEHFLFSKRESIPLDDVKQIQIIRTLIDNLPLGATLRNVNYPYFYQKEILKSISSLKKENILPEKFEQLIELARSFVTKAAPSVEKLISIRATPKAQDEIVNLITNLAKDESLNVLYRSRLSVLLAQYKSNELSLSSLKQEVRDFVDKTSNSLPKLSELLALYRGYNQSLLELHLYDYDDMILWVINAFENSSELLSVYREQYQYILVDEFQDTNSAQYQIINQLVGNDPSPNLFVVGDDDQSIYRFQGASVENVYTFYQKYQSTLKVIVLKNNYRSHRLILDSSNAVISHNTSRITNYIPGLNKDLTSVSSYDPDPINLFVASSSLEESFFIAQRVESLIKSGVAPSQIAILVRANSDINELLPFLSEKKIKYLLADSVNILDTPEIQQLLVLFSYLFDTDNDETLAKILSYNFLEFNATDLFTLFHHTAKNRLSLSKFLVEGHDLSSLNLRKSTIVKINNFRHRLAYINKLINNAPADKIFNEVIRRFKYLPWILKTGRLDLLKQLSTLYTHLKSLLAIEKISLLDWVLRLNILVEDDLGLSSPPLLADVDTSIRLMTVHKAKGLEFEHVFLYRLLSGKWDSSYGRSLIKLPLGIVKTDITSMSGTDLEEDRRLFYVALTRAKKQIYLSYSNKNDSGKEQLQSLFINEIDPHFVQELKSTPESESAALKGFFTASSPSISSPDLQDYIKTYLQTQYLFNVTHLNSYLHCPLCFFFKTILKLPQVKTKPLSFGTSIHGALAFLHDIYRVENRLISLDKFIQIFENNLTGENLSPRDFSELSLKGKEVLTGYYQHYQNSFGPKTLNEHDFRLYRVHLENVPLTGKIDKMELLPNDEVNVVDYKTGKPDSKYQELTPDGDYFRQLVFYKILCDHAHGFKYKVKTGTIDFVEPNVKGLYVRKNYELTPEAVLSLEAQIKEIYKKIQNLEFSPDPKCDDSDHLHQLFSKYFS